MADGQTGGDHRFVAARFTLRMTAQAFRGRRSERRSRPAVRAVLLSLLLGGCGPIMVSSNRPLPYPEGLRTYLSEQWMDREAVHAALGSPTLVRMEGDLELYVAVRQVAAELIMRTPKYDTHYLLVRYRNDGGVLWLGEVVNAGCLPAGVCINRRIDEAASGYGGVSDPQRIVVFADDPADHAAREAEPGSNKCIVYPESGNGKSSGFPSLSIGLPGHATVPLPFTGFVAWSGDAQKHPLRIGFQTGGRYEESRFEFACTDTQPTYYRLFAQRRIGLMFHSYSVQLERVDASIGGAAIGSKRLILSH